MIDTQTTLTVSDLNIIDSTGPEGLPERPANFLSPYCLKCILKWPRYICTTESEWEDNMTQQMPILRTSSPYPDDGDKGLER